MTRSKSWIVGLAAAVAFTLVTMVVLRVTDHSSRRVDASSTASGSAADLVAAVTAARDQEPSARSEVWRSDEAAEGTWLQFTWSEDTTVDHITVLATSDSERAIRSGLLQFSDGSSLMVSTSRGSPDIEVAFPPRQVTSARLIVAEGGAPRADAVALAGAVVDDGAETVVPAGAEDVPALRVSSGGGADALSAAVDLPLDDTGWTPAQDDVDPWVEVSWPTPREVSAVQVVGPPGTAYDPANSAASELHGQLEFADDSSVLVSGIDGGDPQVTTVAFTPRITDVVRLRISPSIEGADVGLRRIRVYSADQTPVRPALTPTVAPLAPSTDASCNSASDPVGRSTGYGLSLVCPAPGTAVSGSWRAVVSGRPGTDLVARTWTAATTGAEVGAVTTVATGTVDEAGLAVLAFAGPALPQGPVNIRISESSPATAAADGTDSSTDVVVQVVNASGVPTTSPGHAPAGMTLQYDEEFRGGLSVNATGAGAAYAATKPAYWGTSQFGDAVFVDPSATSDNAENLGVVADEYLRIRADDLDNRPLDTPYGQQHAAAILSSMRVGAGGFSAQYGYFEARILGAPGEGSWPAFWMMDTESATKRTPDGGEIDAVELYGHDPTGSCHSTHNWTGNQDTGDGSDCLSDNSFSDWTVSWHTYGVQILPAGAVYYIDGVEVSRSTGLRDHTVPYFFMINLALGGGWPVDLAPTGETADMYVDWVHVYT